MSLTADEIIALSIGDAYQHADTFTALLLKIGVDTAGQARLKKDGFTSMELLALQFKNDIKGFKAYLLNLNKTFASNRSSIYFNPIVITKFTGALYFFDQLLFVYHKIPDIRVITVEQLSTWGHLHSSSSSTIDTDQKEADEVILPKFTNMKDWLQFKEKLDYKLSLTKGQNNFSIDYVVNTTERDITIPTTSRSQVNTYEIDDEDIFRCTAVHFGVAFKQDNKRIFSLLKSALLNTGPWDHISRFNKASDGKKAMEALVLYYEGEDFIKRQQEKAFYTFDNTCYRGESKQFSWDGYVQKHLTAHALLLKIGYNNGNGLDESTKIQYLKRNIKPEADLENALTISRTTSNIISDFQKFANFIAAEVDHKTLRKSQLHTARQRNVSKFTKGNTHQGNNGKGRANKSGQRYNSNRPNRGNHKNNNHYGPNRNNHTSDNRGPVLSAMVNGKRIEGKHYSASEYQKMDFEQRNKIGELTRKRKAQQGNHATGQNPTVASLAKFTDTMTDIGDAIVACVSHASREPGDLDDLTLTSRRSTAEAGSVGNFIAEAKRRKANKRNNPM